MTFHLRRSICQGALLLLLVSVTVVPCEAQNGKKGPAQEKAPGSTFHTEVPEHAGSVVLGRPTRSSITVSLLSHASMEGILVWGSDARALPARGRTISLKAGESQEVTLEGLAPDTKYFYELRDVVTGKRLLPVSEPGTFHTARPSGTAFTFTVIADSHLDEHTASDLYLRTLANVRADKPDFHVDLGDTFMTDKHDDRDSAAKQYLAQRYYLGLIGQSAPVYLVLGNHDGEDSKLLRGGADSLAVWSNRMRKLYFPNPVPDGFYTGNSTKDPLAGLLQDYYAWEWGDALFVVLDPYWHSPGRLGDDCWGLTLGAEQYQWLQKTLESSKARFRFVFIHQLVGGLDKQGRGGAEAASFGEWGGKNSDGTDGFKEHRPGWAVPIHQLLVCNYVTVVFHGHDHLFARQGLDGIVYQEVPQPGFPGPGGPRNALEYGYISGDILGSSGHMRVTVAARQVTVEYVRSWLSTDESAPHKNGETASRCQIESKGGKEQEGPVASLFPVQGSHA